MRGRVAKCGTKRSTDSVKRTVMEVGDKGGIVGLASLHKSVSHLPSSLSSSGTPAVLGD